MKESASLPVRPGGLSLGNKAGRIAWQTVYTVFFRTSPVPLFAWRNFLLRLFGARIGAGVHVYPSTRIWAPWNLSLGDHSCLAFQVDCYCVGKVSLGAHATVSQYSYLCAATHDYRDPGHGLVPGSIDIGPEAWVAADVFVGPDVRIGPGAVVGARASVFRDVPAWTVAVGNPAKSIKKRVMTPVSPRP